MLALEDLGMTAVVAGRKTQELCLLKRRTIVVQTCKCKTCTDGMMSSTTYQS